MQQILESLSVIFISPFRDTFSGLLWCVFLAVILAIAYHSFRRRAILAVLKKLSEEGCVSSNTAKDARLLFGEKEPLALRFRDRLIACTNEEPPRYYLPEECTEKAAYYRKSGNSPAWQILLGIVALYAALVAIYYLLPTIIDLSW